MPYKIECTYCHWPIIMSAIEPGKRVKCPQCEKSMIIPNNYAETNLTSKAPENSIVPNDDQSVHRPYGEIFRTGANGVLGIFAWISLVVGIIGAIIIWSKYGGDSYEINIAGIFVGVAVLIESILSCAFFLVIENIAENLAAIRKNTEAK